MVVTRLRSRLGQRSETNIHNENDLEERKDPEDRESSPPGLGGATHPPAPLEPETKVRNVPGLDQRCPNGGCVFQEYVFSKRKIYNTPLTKYWVVRHGEPLPSPPPEANASECSGPAVFVNVPREGEKQIWLWNTDRQVWNAVPIKHTVDLDVRRQLNLNSKNVPVFIVPRAGRERGEVEGSQFVRYLAHSL